MIPDRPSPRGRRRVRRAALALTFALFGAAAPAAHADTAPLLYPLAAQQTAGVLTTDPAGNVYFAETDQNTYYNSDPTQQGGNRSRPSIGKFVPSQMVPGTATGLTLYPTVEGQNCCATRVSSLAFDNAKGHLWFARNDGAFGWGDPSAMTAGTENGQHSAALPGGTDIEGLAVDQKSHAVWFTEYSASNVASSTANGIGYYRGDRLARTDESLSVAESNNIAQQHGEADIHNIRYDAKPMGVSVGPDGHVWFGESDRGYPGYRIARDNALGYDEYDMVCPTTTRPCPNGNDNGLDRTQTAAAADGSVWYLNPRMNRIGHLVPAGTGGGQPFQAEYSLASFAAIDPTIASSKPYDLTAAADGTLWLTESASYSSTGKGNAIIKITPAGTADPTATIFPTGPSLSRVTNLAVSATGDVWFSSTDASSKGTIGRLVGAATPTGTIIDNPGPITTTPVAGGDAPTPAAPAGTPTAPATGSGTVKLAVAGVGTAQLSKPTTSDDTLSQNQICVGPPQDRCSLVYLLQTHEYVAGFPGSGSRATAKPKAKPKASKRHQTIGSLAVTLSGGESKLIKVRLSAKARKALALQGHIKAQLTVTQKQADGTFKVIQTKLVTFKAKKAKKAKKK